MEDLSRELLPALHDAGAIAASGRRRFSDAERPPALRPNLVAVSNSCRTRSPSDEAVVDDAAESVQIPQHVCNTSECAVLQLFETTELLEMILDELCTDDILSLRLTRRSWNSTVCMSPMLRLHFFVHPQWTRHPADFQLLNLKIPGLDIELGDEIEMGRWIKIRMTAAAAGLVNPPSQRVRSRSIFEGLRGGFRPRAERGVDTWPASPSKDTGQAPRLRYESLFVTQPPILGVQACVSSGKNGSDGSLSGGDDTRACAKLHCGAGIKIGFLAETTLSLLSDTRFSEQEDHRSVLFKAIVSFAPLSRAAGARSSVRSVTRIG